MTEADIRRRTASSFRWAVAGKLIVQIFSWAATILVMRLLEPSDYGINAMAMVVIGLGLMLAEFGLSTALVQARTLDNEGIRTAFGFVLLLNAAVMSLVLVSTPFVAGYFKRSELLLVLPIAALQFPILALSSIPSALLERDLRFKEKAIQSVVASVVAAAATLALAWYGVGYWALILGALLNGLISVLLLWIAVPWPKRPIFRGMFGSSVLRFAGAVTIGRFLWYAYSNADTLIVGRRLGDVALGFYAVATEIASTPLNKLAAPLSQVMTAAVARLRDDPRAAERMSLDAIHLVSVVAFPVYFGIALVADEVVSIFLGEKWIATAPLIALVALIGPLRAVGIVLMSAITASGESRLQITSAVLACVLFPSAFILGSYLGGLTGVAVAWVVAYPVYFGYLVGLSARLLGLTAGRILRSAFVPFAGTAIMAGITYSASHLADSEAWIRLLIEVGSGVVSYLLFMLAFDRAAIMKLLRR